MLNAIRVDFRRYLMTKSFMLLVLIAAVIQPLGLVAIMKGVAKALDFEYTISMNDFSGYTSIAAIYLAVFVTGFLYAEAGEGIIRNKIISGKKRYEIILSYCLVNSVLAVLLQVVSVLTTVLSGFCFSVSFEPQTSEIIRFTAVSALAGVAISIFYTVLFLCFCTVKVSIALPVTVAVVMKIVLIIIVDALYPDSGIPKVTGSTLKIYEGIDRFFAFSHLTGGLRWDNVSYICGNAVLIVISMIIGILVFSKKDMK